MSPPNMFTREVEKILQAGGEVHYADKDRMYPPSRRRPEVGFIDVGGQLVVI